MARRIRFVEYNGNRYFTSDKGIMKLESPTSLYRPAGQPRGLDLTLAGVDVTAGLLTTAGYSVAYRLVWGIKDSNSNVVIGAPSNRANFVADPGAGMQQNVNVTFLIPAYITTANFFQIYRTKIDTTVGTDPGDETYLVYEGNPTVADISAGSMTIADIRPDDIIGQPAYFNASQEGIGAANYQPPLARDLAEFRDYMFYSNTTGKQNLTITLISMAGFSAGTSQITIGGVTYNCAAYSGNYSTSPTGENPGAGVFVYYTAGLPSERIRGTAESLCRVINRYSSNTQYYAYYSSQVDETPGIIYLEERGIGGPSFAVISDATIQNDFEPQLPTSGVLIQSGSDSMPNGLFFSKYQQPEAVPKIFFKPVGAKNEPIQRILKLRDSLIIIKEKSIWQLTGTDEISFVVAPLDMTVSIDDRYDSAAVLDNQVYALTNQGLVSVSNSGVEILSRSEEFRLRFPTFDSDGFSVGIGFEYLRSYFISTFDAEFKQEGYAYPYTTYAYNTGSDPRSITRQLINASCFTVFKNKLYYGLNNNTGKVMKQRTYAYEFYDELSSVSISAIDTAAKTATLTFNPSVDYDGYIAQFGYGYLDGIDYGFVIVDRRRRYLVTHWDPINSKATLHTVAGLTTGEKDCYRPIPMHIEWMPLLGQSPFLSKDFTDILLLAACDDAHELYWDFANELDTKKYFFYYKYSSALTTIKNSLNDLQANWVQTGCTPLKLFKNFVPNAKRKSTLLSVRFRNNVAGSRISLKGITVETRETGSNNVTR